MPNTLIPGMIVDGKVAKEYGNAVVEAQCDAEGNIDPEELETAHNVTRFNYDLFRAKHPELTGNPEMVAGPVMKANDGYVCHIGWYELALVEVK